MSAIHQSYNNIEIILVDNNSQDSTFPLLLKYRDKYPIITAVLQEEQQGAPAARNRGLSIANGDWIQFLDADDFIHPLKIEKQLKFVKSSTDIIVGAWEHKLLNGKIIETLIDPTIHPLLLLFKGGGVIGNTCSNLYKKESIEKIGGWNESMNSSQESELMFRLFLNGASMEISPEILTTVYKRTSGQISKENSVDYAEYILNFRYKMLKVLQQHHSDFVKQNQHYFDNEIYKYIRLLTTLDYQKGVQEYQKYFDHQHFIPDGNHRGNPKWNEWAVRLMGFQRTEKLKAFYKRLSR